MVIETLQCIHLALFLNHAGSVIKYLANVIEPRFGVSDIPSGWFLWPMAMEGLKSPLTSHFAIHDRLCVDAAKKLKDTLDSEKKTYTKYQEKWNSADTDKRIAYYWDLRDKPFMSYEEYARHREKCLGWWQGVNGELVEVPLPDSAGGGVAGPLYLVTELSNLLH